MKKKIALLIVIVAGLVVGGVYYEKNYKGSADKKTYFNEKTNSKIIADLKSVLDMDISKLADDNSSIFSDSQLTDEIVGILNKDIAEIEQRLEQANNDDYSSDDRFMDFNILALKYQGLADWNKVGEIYKKTAELYPEEPLAWYNLATYQIKAGEWRSANDSLFQSIELDEKFAPAWLQLMDFYRFNVKADFQTMDELYNLAILKTNNDNNLMRGYAEYLEKNNKIDEAINTWKRIYENNEENRDVILERINKLEASK